MPGTPKKTGPVTLSTTTTTNLMQGGGGDATKYDVITQLRVTNRTGIAARFSIWLGGANGNVAGTEQWIGKQVSANDVYVWYGRLPLKSTEYLVGGADTANALTITIEHEQNIVP